MGIISPEVRLAVYLRSGNLCEECFGPGDLGEQAQLLEVSYCRLQSFNPLASSQKNSPRTMLFAGHSNKILRAIVQTFPVKVMNYPILRQHFPVCLFPNKDVLIDISLPSSRMTMMQDFPIRSSAMRMPINVHPIFDRNALAIPPRPRHHFGRTLSAELRSIHLLLPTIGARIEHHPSTPRAMPCS